jgi:hypothetical protein
MKFAFVSVLYLSMSNLCAQTFSFPYNEKECSASAAICSTLLQIQKHTPKDVSLNTIKIQGESLIIDGNSPGYKGIGIFVENLTMIPAINGRMSIVSTHSGVAADKKRIEHFQLEGKLNP